VIHSASKNDIDLIIICYFPPCVETYTLRKEKNELALILKKVSTAIM